MQLKAGHLQFRYTSLLQSTDVSTRNTLSLVLDAAVVSSSIATLVLANHRRLRMVAGWKHLYLCHAAQMIYVLDTSASLSALVPR